MTAVVFREARTEPEEDRLSTAVPLQQTRPPTPTVAAVPVRRPVDLWWPVLAGAVGIALAWTWWHLGRGAIMHDEGSLGQAAERVLRGELPHRDFDDIYTGGLALLNAWAFRLLGTSLWTLRVVLLAAFAAWVPLVYYVATRFVRPLAGGAVTLLAVAWSVPNYTAAMPSWYNLFLATAGVAALMRFLERQQRRWLFVAGVAGGLSILVKVVGLYYVAGVLLFLVFQARAGSRADAPKARAPLYATFVTLALALFVAALVGLVRHQLFVAEMVDFVLPGALLAAWLAFGEWTSPAGPDGARFRSLIRHVVPFALGIALPVALFLIPYLASGAVPALVQGVFILPTKRFGAAVFHPAPLQTAWSMIPLALIVAAVRRWPAIVRPWTVVLLAVVLALVIAIAAVNVHLYRFAWRHMYLLVPVLTIAGLLVLQRERAEDRRAPLRRSQLALLLTVSALCSLVQFPFAAPVYLLYVLPLAFLTATALYTYLRPFPAPLAGVVVAFFLVFAAARVNDNPVYALGGRYVPLTGLKAIPMPRGGVEGYADQVDAVGQIGQLLREHARGPYTWASPDSPEVYFLTGMRNPTRTLFDFFDDPRDRKARLLAMLDERGITAIVLNRNPEFSAPITNDMYDELVRRFPSSAEAGHFQVRWRQ